MQQVDKLDKQAPLVDRPQDSKVNDGPMQVPIYYAKVSAVKKTFNPRVMIQLVLRSSHADLPALSCTFHVLVDADAHDAVVFNGIVPADEQVP